MSGGATRFLHLDRLGTNARTTDASGAVVGAAGYDAFGRQTQYGNVPGSQAGFASAFGYQEDGETNLKLLGHRYYDPSTGRFLTRDPAQDGRNWYAYGAGNPLKYIDDDGDYIKWVGGSWQERVAIIIALENIAKTKGGDWANDVLNGPLEYTINVVRGADQRGGGSKGSPYFRDITFDVDNLNDVLFRAKGDGYENFTWERILAHEFGHVRGHTLDEQEVVDKFENELAAALGLPLRGDYYDTRPVSKKKRRKIPYPTGLSKPVERLR